MFIRIGFDIVYSFPQPTAMIMMLYTHPSRSVFLMQPEQLTAGPSVLIEDFIDVYGNRCARASCPAGRVNLRNDTVMVDGGLPDRLSPDAIQHSIHDLPTETLLYLLGSRYCEIEKLSEAAWDLFGAGPSGWARVQAICDWVHQHITFSHKFARCDRTAYDSFVDQRGVCRDYAHLAIALCRCMGIPARYATGYLGDIEVPLVPPMDFSAWFEAYLGGQWHTFDARNNQPRIGRILMARGRDAADVALTTTFGKHTLEKFDIWTDEIDQAQAVQAHKARSVAQI
jgi:transglutaminase-like putative cysteine protease